MDTQKVTDDISLVVEIEFSWLSINLSLKTDVLLPLLNIFAVFLYMQNRYWEESNKA